MSTAREKPPGHKYYISVYAFADVTRFIEDIDDRYLPLDYINYHVDVLKDPIRAYLKSRYMTRWHNQPKYVEVMIEKNALRGAYREVLSDMFDDSRLHVRVVPNNGWSSKIYKQQTIDRLLAHKEGHTNNGEGPKDVYVLNFGDYDPTGY